MSATAERILELLQDPEGLEALYRQEPEAFSEGLAAASAANPDSVALRTWRARLEYKKPAHGAAGPGRLVPAIAIALGFGALLRVPALWLGDEWFYPRFLPSVVMLALAAYFWMGRRDRRLLIIGLTLAVVAAAYVSLLPGDPISTDSVVMAVIHMPLVIWAFLGIVFTGDSWRDADARVRFVRYNGELVVLGSVVALGFGVFSGLTVSLFEMVSEGAAEWYFTNIGVFGVTAVPIAGTYLYEAVFNRRTGIPAVLAKVFAPLFLVMSVIYLSVAFVEGENPFTDRDFLITFNGLLLVVLLIAIFSMIERSESSDTGFMDYINLALVGVTLLINVVALSAILFRLASYGFTPNRVTVLGANLVIMGHLAWLGWTYVGFVRQRVELGVMRRVVGSYLPMYVAWAAVVVFVLPLVFGFA